MTPRVTCPLCGSPMVMRQGMHGNFYGCTDFPSCRGVRSASYRQDDDFCLSINDRNALEDEEEEWDWRSDE